MPDTVPQTQSNGLDAASMVQQILSQNQGQLTAAAQRASIPISGGHATSVPQSMLTPSPEAKGGQQDHSEVVGRGNARAQGIGNAVVGVVHALATTESALDNKKKLEVASATQQLITAQSAFDQAKEALAADPNNADAKAALDRNKSVMNGILGNDKIRKAIAKGMNIDFTDPKANDSLEHAGVAHGKEMAQQHLDYASQFNEKTPMTMQPNQAAIAQYKALQEQQKLNTETMKAFVPLAAAQVRANSAQSVAEGRNQTALTREQMRDAMEAAKATTLADAAWERQSRQIQANAQRDKSKFGYEMAEITKRASLAMTNFKAKMTMKGSDPISQVKAYTEFSTKTSGEIGNLNSKIASMEKTKQDILIADPTDKQGQVKSISDAISATKDTLGKLQTASEATDSWYRKLSGVGDSNAGSDPNGTPRPQQGTLSSSATYLDSPDDTTPEEHSDDEF